MYQQKLIMNSSMIAEKMKKRARVPPPVKSEKDKTKKEHGSPHL
jgi:hypothetical protein